HFNDAITVCITRRFAGLRVLLAKLVMSHYPAAYCRHIGSALLSAKSTKRLAACYPRANGFGNLRVIICRPGHYGVSSTPSLYTSVTRPGYFLFIWGAAAIAHFSICTLKSSVPNDCTT